MTRTARIVCIAFASFPILPQPRVDAQSYARQLTASSDSAVFIMGKGLYSSPDLPLPKKITHFKDPSFGTAVLRLTDKTIDGYQGPGIQNEYAKTDPENADGSLLILRGNHANWYLYDRKSGALLREIEVFRECNQEPEPRWDAQNPKRFFYLCNTSLRVYDTGNDSSWTVRDFSPEFLDGFILTTGTEGDASLDKDRWCFMVKNSAYELLSVIVYEISSGLILGRMDKGFADALNWVGMSMSGAHCIFGYENLNYADVYARDLQSRISLPAGSNGHGDLARTADGRDVLVYQNVATDFIAMADLDTGVETPLISLPFDVNTDIGLHVSGNCAATPGWALVSTYGSRNPPTGRQHSWMDNQLFMVELKAEPRIWRLAHTHSYTSLDFDGEKNYFAEAFAAINTAGTRVHFGSNWSTYTEEYSDAYIVELPDAWMDRLPGTTRVFTPEESSVITLSVYPNPSNGKATLCLRRGTGINLPLQWRITDVLGRATAQGKETVASPGEASVLLDLTLVPKGLYYLHVSAGSTTYKARAIVVSP